MIEMAKELRDMQGPRPDGERCNESPPERLPKILLLAPSTVRRSRSFTPFPIKQWGKTSR